MTNATICSFCKKNEACTIADENFTEVYCLECLEFAHVSRAKLIGGRLSAGETRGEDTDSAECEGCGETFNPEEIEEIIDLNFDSEADECGDCNCGDPTCGTEADFDGLEGLSEFESD